MYDHHVIWFTGFSGSGKSTLADLVSKELTKYHVDNFRLDGDVLREGLCADLGFSINDREENIRRASEIAKIICNTRKTVIASFITPTHKTQQIVREIIGNNFIEVFIDCPLEICEKRDVKGLYQKARMGEINNFTGIDSKYEQPSSPEIIINTNLTPINTCVQEIVSVILPKIISQ